MLLRASGEQTVEAIDFGAVMNRDRRIGIRWGTALNALVEALLSGDAATLRRCCEESEVEMGAEAVRDTLVVAAAFNGITRVADATGIPLDEPTVTATKGLRAEIGIDRFDYPAKSDRYA